MKKYGRCRMCDCWVPRDEMVGLNARLWGDQPDHIRIRLCVDDFRLLEAQLRALEWDDELKGIEELSDEDERIG